MILFDTIIEDTNEKIASITTKSWDYDATDCWKNLERSELIMQSDQIYELGGSGTPSANFTCVTTNMDLVPKDEVILCGKDLNELHGDVSFARIVLLGVNDIGDEDAAHSAIQQIDFVRYHVFPDGYMVRVSAESNQERVRVSKAAFSRGISFKTIGNTYVKAYKENENVRSVRIIFLTDQEIIAEFNKTANKVYDITNALSHILDGFDVDCASCSLKPVCDEVEGMKEMHLGKKKK
ncbi:MAG: hypothetical protein MJ143_05670 [Clostridia bacterium]|nr:hypothetical protein [Clostridia bacterium]